MACDWGSLIARALGLLIPVLRAAGAAPKVNRTQTRDQSKKQLFQTFCITGSYSRLKLGSQKRIGSHFFLTKNYLFIQDKAYFFLSFPLSPSTGSTRGIEGPLMGYNVRTTVMITGPKIALLPCSLLRLHLGSYLA